MTTYSVTNNIPLSDEALTEFYGSRELRWFQIAARTQAIQAINNGSKRILIQLPTGSGKTLCIAAAMSHPDMKKALNVPHSRPTRVLFMAHKHRLLSQAEAAFVDNNNVDLILQSMMSKLPQSTIDSGWDICIFDECHHEAALSAQYHLEKLGEKPIIGLTATVDRMDGCIIKFDVIINPISREQAVAEGYLAPTKIHSFVDVPSKDKVAVLTDIFENYAHQMGQTMVFVQTKKEVLQLTVVLKNLGYVAVGLLGQSDKELDNILNKFSEGWIQFIVNCSRISEGIDVQGCTDIVIGRQMGSYTMLNQTLGRAARIDSDCNCWELINPLSNSNLDTTVVVGTPESHRLVYKEGGKWKENNFDYTTHRTNKQLGIASGLRIGGAH